MVDGPQADFTRGLRSAAMGLSALLLEDGRFTVYGRNRCSFIFSWGRAPSQTSFLNFFKNVK